MWIYLETLNMRRIIITAIIGVVSIVATILSACTPTNQNPLVGQWEHNDVSGNGEYAINSTLIFTFNSDGTGVAEFKANGNYIQPTSKRLKLTYSEFGDTLVINYTESGQTMKNIIRKLDDNSLLVVGLGEDGQELDFIKINQ